MVFIPSENTPAFMLDMRVNPRSEEERTTAFRPWESIGCAKYECLLTFVFYSGINKAIS